MSDLYNSGNTEPQITSNSDNSSYDNNSLDGVFGKDDDNNSDKSLSDNTENSNNEPVISDETSENNIDSDKNSITYYTKEELEEFSKPENFDTIDINRIPPELKWAVKLFQRPYTQKNQKLSDDRKSFEQEKEEFEKSKQTFQEQLEEFRKEQEQISKKDILDTGRLSINDEMDINLVSLSKTEEYLGEEFDNNNTEHISVFNSIKNRLVNTVYNKRVKESISNRLQNKYGNDFVVVERAVQKEFSQLPHQDAVTFLRALQTGRYDIIEKFYDTTYNKLIEEYQKQKEPLNNNAPVKKYPPNTLKGESTVQGGISKSSMYDTSGIL